MEDLEVQTFSEIILPPGSTSTELQAAVNDAASGDTITISSDMPFTGTVTIPSGKAIVMQSDAGNNWVMLSPGSMNTRHFIVKGSLELQSILLDGGNIGGGVNPQNGSFTMNSGCVIQNCFVDTGGGGVYGFFSTFTMNSGSVIQNCSVSYPTNNVDGGGVYLVNSTFHMNSGSIIQNCYANGSGGGISAGGTGVYSMVGCIVRGNRAGRHGGGVATANDVVFHMDGVTISGNTAGLRGGGVYVLSRSAINITGESHIEQNSARDGGGICTMDTNYANLSTVSGTVFSDNQALAAYAPPVDATTVYPNIKFASTTIMEHPLNNFDINHTGEEPVTYHVSYDANGGAGSYQGPDIVPGGTDTVLSPEETVISREGYAFTGWNTEADGGGTGYTPGDTILLNGNSTLYAQWIAVLRYTVTYGANGGSGGFVDPGRQYGVSYTILSTSQTGVNYPGYTFTGWNTEADGSGLSFTPGEIITITGDVALYAQWRQNPAPKQKKLCRAPATKCRMSIEGQKIWNDNGNSKNTRPASIKINLLRDDEFYKSVEIDSAGDGAFAFCCLPKWKNSGHPYIYRVDEAEIPAGYTKTVEGYTVINTFTP